MVTSLSAPPKRARRGRKTHNARKKTGKGKQPVSEAFLVGGVRGGVEKEIAKVVEKVEKQEEKMEKIVKPEESKFSFIRSGLTPTAVSKYHRRRQKRQKKVRERQTASLREKAQQGEKETTVRQKKEIVATHMEKAVKQSTDSETKSTKTRSFLLSMSTSTASLNVTPETSATTSSSLSPRGQIAGIKATSLVEESIETVIETVVEKVSGEMEKKVPVRVAVPGSSEFSFFRQGLTPAALKKYRRRREKRQKKILEKRDVEANVAKRKAESMPEKPRLTATRSRGPVKKAQSLVVRVRDRVIESRRSVPVASCLVRTCQPVVAHGPVVAGSEQEMTSPLECKTLEWKTLKCKTIEQVPEILMTRIITSYLAAQDLCRLSMVSKWGLRHARSQHTWKSLYTREVKEGGFGQGNIPESFADIMDWHKAYKLSNLGIINQFRCFHSKRTFYDNVIGVPLETTVNPRLRRIDYISPTMDLLSHRSFCSKSRGGDAIRVTHYGVRFEHWLPLFLTAGHFDRALPILKHQFVTLCQHWGDSNDHPDYRGRDRRRTHVTRVTRRPVRFDPLMVLDVIPKTMTTFAVLLADQGIKACDKALNGFMHIHRLFLALAQKFPEIQVEADKRIFQFLKSEENRHKNKVRSLGDWLPLLCISDRFKWRIVWRHFLSETFDRSILWLGKHDPSLARIPPKDSARFLKTPPTDSALSPSETRHLEKSADAMRVRLRVTMFFVYFLKMFCTGTTKEQAFRYDRYFGDKVPHGVPSTDEMKVAIRKRLEIKSWDQIFASIGAAFPGERKVLDILTASIKNSYRRGYTRKGMDFTRVQKSGVSKIIQRGESYKIDKKISGIRMGTGWTSPFDIASGLILFHPKTHNVIEFIDWQNLASTKFSITHSGDVVNGSNGVGAGNDQEVVWVELNSLVKGRNTPILVFCMSIWTTGKTFKHLSNGFLRMVDHSNGQEKCRFPLDFKQYGDRRAVVLAKMEYNVDKHQWDMITIGEALDSFHREPRDMWTPIANRYLRKNYRNENNIH
ncbi:hypothetical protein AAMO2058_001131400 [Amorphochlora amoebiformis]